MLGHEEIQKRFGSSVTRQDEHQIVRGAFYDFANQLDALLPDGRTKAVAFTELENASMWAHKSLAEKTVVVEEAPNV